MSARHPVILLALLAACGGDAPPAEPFVVTDSAGVRLAMSNAAAWPEGGGWRVGDAPSLLIGGDITDRGDLVGPISGAFRLPDGRVVVVDGGAHALKWFGPDGVLQHQVGRRGDGPGEFSRITRVLVVADSIAIVDLDLRRVTLFSLDGDVGRTLTLVSAPGAPFPPTPIGRMAGGDWIGMLRSWHSSGGGGGARRDSVWIWRMDRSGTPVEQLLALPGNDVIVASNEQFVGSMVSPLGRRTTVRFHDGDLWVGTGDDPVLERVRDDGSVLHRVRWAAPGRPVTSDLADAQRDTLRAPFMDAPESPIASAYLAAAAEWRPPAELPAYDTFRLDDQDHLWVADYALDEAAARAWQVFDPDGRWLGPVTMPPGFVPSHISDREIVGVWTDPDGLERVVVYPLSRDTAAP